MKKLHGLKKAVGDFQKNCEHLHCVIYLDTEYGSIWTNVYADENSYSDYHSKTIHALNTYFYQANRCEGGADFKVSMKTVRKTAEFVAAEYEREDIRS